MMGQAIGTGFYGLYGGRDVRDGGDGDGCAVLNPLTAMHFAHKGLTLRPLAPDIDFKISAIRPFNRQSEELSKTFLTLLWGTGGLY